MIYRRDGAQRRVSASRLDGAMPRRIRRQNDPLPVAIAARDIFRSPPSFDARAISPGVVVGGAAEIAAHNALTNRNATRDSRSEAMAACSEQRTIGTGS